MVPRRRISTTRIRSTADNFLFSRYFQYVRMMSSTPPSSLHQSKSDERVVDNDDRNQEPIQSNIQRHDQKEHRQRNIQKKKKKIQMYKKIRSQPIEQKGQLSHGRKPTRSGYIHFGYHQDQRHHRHRLYKTTLNNKIIVTVTVITVTTDFQMYNFAT
jgi:hypothetical protein